MRARFHAFLKRFWQLARAGDRVEVRAGGRQHDLCGVPVERCTVPQNQQVEPLAMMNVDCLGNVSTFSPELLGYKNSDYNDFLIGNINTDSRWSRSAIAGGSRRCSFATSTRAWRHAGAEELAKSLLGLRGWGTDEQAVGGTARSAARRRVSAALVQMAAADLVLASARDLQQNWNPVQEGARLAS